MSRGKLGGAITLGFAVTIYRSPRVRERARATRGIRIRNLEGRAGSYGGGEDIRGSGNVSSPARDPRDVSCSIKEKTIRDRLDLRGDIKPLISGRVTLSRRKPAVRHRVNVKAIVICYAGIDTNYFPGDSIARCFNKFAYRGETK